MRKLVLVLPVFLLGLTAACGGAQKPKCFECGITDEWARAEQEEKGRERPQTVPCPSEDPEQCGESGAGSRERPQTVPCPSEDPERCGDSEEKEQELEGEPERETGAESGAGTATDATATTEEARGLVAQVAGLSAMEPVEGGYDRKAWKHWVDEDGDCQDTRQEVLIAESEIPVTFKTPRECKVASGQWTCPYTGEVFTNPRKLDIDHMVPLGAAHASGASLWDAERRRDFANSLESPEHLIAVKASANRSKGKKGPEAWLPPDESYVCTYVEHWVAIKVRWELGVSAGERTALERISEKCE